MDYTYKVTAKHRAAGFTPELLEQHWLPLFEATLRDYLPEATVKLWMVQARRLGGAMSLNHQYWQAHQQSPSKGKEALLEALRIPPES